MMIFIMMKMSGNVLEEMHEISYSDNYEEKDSGRKHFLGMDKDTQTQKDRERGGGQKKRYVAETITIAKSTINSV